MTIEKTIQLPKIPKYVAEWVEDNKNIGIYYALYLLTLRGSLPEIYPIQFKIAKYLGVNSFKNFDNKEKLNNLMTAMLFGYEIEDPLYHALIKGGRKLELEENLYNSRYYQAGESLNISSSNITRSSRIKTLDEWNELGLSEENADFYPEKEFH